jgi:ubiquitin C-terminal hydrolase
MKDMWSGYSSVNPSNFKQQIGIFAPQFHGFAQQDSQELLAFLLVRMCVLSIFELKDGLHEDLNRVINKEYVELKESNGRTDEIVSAESWNNHLKRNNSAILDMFLGELRVFNLW